MKLFKYLKSLISNKLEDKCKEHKPSNLRQETPKKSYTPSSDSPERLLTMSQAAQKKGVTRQAIFFAIKMKRLNANRKSGTWLISDSDLKEYDENRYTRSKSMKEGQLIFDKSKGYYSISDAAKFLGKNTNQIYYLVRMGRLKTHRQGSAIIIKDSELYKYAELCKKYKYQQKNLG